jgi:hypothetical protein
MHFQATSGAQPEASGPRVLLVRPAPLVKLAQPARPVKRAPLAQLGRRDLEARRELTARTVSMEQMGATG